MFIGWCIGLLFESKFYCFLVVLFNQWIAVPVKVWLWSDGRAIRIFSGLLFDLKLVHLPMELVNQLLISYLDLVLDLPTDSMKHEINLWHLIFSRYTELFISCLLEDLTVKNCFVPTYFMICFQEFWIWWLISVPWLIRFIFPIIQVYRLL